MKAQAKPEAPPTMATAAPEGVVARKQKIRWRLRLAVYAGAILLSVLAVGDVYFETVGLPSMLEAQLERRLAERGIHLRLQNVRCGLFNGVVVEEVVLTDAEMGGWRLFTAARLRCDYDLDWQHRRLKLAKLNIEQGRLSLPWFPEAGREGANDVLVLDNLETRLSREADGSIRIEYLSGDMAGILLQASGEMTPPAAALTEQESRTEARRVVLSAKPFLIRLAPSLRTQLAMVLEKVRRENGQGAQPRCQADLRLRFDDPMASQIRARIELPRISYGRVHAHDIRGELLLAEGYVGLRNLSIQFADKQHLRINGTYNLASKSVSGVLRGQISPALLAPLVEPQCGETVTALLAAEPTPADISATLDESLPFEGKFRGTLNFALARFQLAGLVCRNLDGEIRIPEDGRKAIFLPRFHAAIEGAGDVSVSGQMDLVAGLLSGTVSGTLAGDFLYTVPHSLKMLQGMPLDLRNSSIGFEGTVNRMSVSDLAVDGELKLAVDRLRFQDATFAEAQGRLFIAGDVIRGRGVTARTDDGNAIAGNFDWHPMAGLFTSDFSCRGAPFFLPLLLPESDRHYIENLYSELRWPEDPAGVEADGAATVIYGQRPFFLLTADIVMQDFAWRGISFRHGAARLQIDAAKLLLIPAMVLERPEGRAVLSLVYDQRDNAAEDVSSPWFPKDVGPRNRVVVDFDSTLSGDAFLPCLYPEWKPGTAGLDLAQSLPVKGGGTVDYLHPEQTRIDAQVNAANGAWHGMSLKEVKTAVVIGNRGLALPDFKAKLCDGDLALNYQFDYATKKGRVEATLQHAGFADVLAAVNDQAGKADTKGELSGRLAADLRQEDDGSVGLYGTGVVAVRDADLWDIPLLSELSMVLRRGFGLGDWGRITRLDADLALLGDHLHAEPVRTDGTVIALDAQGDYMLASGDYDFTIRTKLLRESLPLHLLTRLMDPVGWLLETRVRRTDGKVSWEQVSGVRKLLTPLERLKPDSKSKPKP